MISALERQNQPYLCGFKPFFGLHSEFQANQSYTVRVASLLFPVSPPWPPSFSLLSLIPSVSDTHKNINVLSSNAL